MQKNFIYRNIEFSVIPNGSGKIQCTAVWPRSIYNAYRKPISWSSNNTLAYDYCTKENIPKGSYYKTAKAAQREFYTEYKEQLDKISWYN